eukprot:scaffold50694_cov62-Phaeocystis_antarctica.AAC.4
MPTNAFNRRRAVVRGGPKDDRHRVGDPQRANHEGTELDRQPNAHQEEQLDLPRAVDDDVRPGGRGQSEGEGAGEGRAQERVHRVAARVGGARSDHGAEDAHGGRIGHELGREAGDEEDDGHVAEVRPLDARELLGDDRGQSRLDGALPDHIRAAEAQQQVEVELLAHGPPVQHEARRLGLALRGGARGAARGAQHSLQGLRQRAAARDDEERQCAHDADGANVHAGRSVGGPARERVDR